ncbi:MAG: hypothetical protein ABSA39_18840 [Edaphobacter sp.]
MKTLLCTLILATLATAAAKADTITVTFDQANQTATPGETLQFFGTITNDSADTIFLNSDDPDLNGLSLTVDDQFFNTVPVSLAPGESSGDIELFDVSVSNPLVDAPGTFSGAYTLFGGADGNAQDNLGTEDFSVTTNSPVPEPAPVLLLLTGALAACIPLSIGARNHA